jgi:hypothetical protein
MISAQRQAWKEYLENASTTEEGSLSILLHITYLNKTLNHDK